LPAVGNFRSRLLAILTGVSLLGLSELAPGQAPSITMQPKSQIVLLGRTAVFQVLADGVRPLAYQWQFNGTDIPCATNATFSLSATRADLPGLYRVTVSNAHGTARSQDAWFSSFGFEKTNGGSAYLTVWGVGLHRFRIEVVTNLATPAAWETLATVGVLLNVNTATVEQLTQLPGIVESLALAIIRSRAGPDGVEGTEDDMPFRAVQELATRVPQLPPLVLSDIYRFLTTTDQPVSRVVDPKPPGWPGPPAPIYQARFYRVVLSEETNP
jgi:hypothetical protein